MITPYFFLLVLQIAAVDEVNTVGIGVRAPEFTLPWATRDTISFTGKSLSEMIGTSPVILAFYPADWSGGCTKEMCTLRDNFTTLKGLGANVYGISGDYLFSHHEWAKHHQLQFPLLSDHSHDIARRYQSFNEETGYNYRTVFVVDRSGIVRYVDRLYKVGTPDSFERLKEALSELR